MVLIISEKKAELQGLSGSFQAAEDKRTLQTRANSIILKATQNEVGFSSSLPLTERTLHAAL
jgi:hypothetical protein